MHNGVCLTVVEHGAWAGGCWWAVQAVAETLSRTTLGDLQVGDRVNLEPSLRLGDELGGHFVFGHVDGVGEIVSVQSQGADSWRVGVQAPDSMARFLAEKCSIAVDGVSLTVAAAKGAYFELAIIPHTWLATTLGQSVPGRRVNLEADMLARYVARQLQKD
jgi:riboflavin synthase